MCLKVVPRTLIASGRSKIFAVSELFSVVIQTTQKFCFFPPGMTSTLDERACQSQWEKKK